MNTATKLVGLAALATTIAVVAAGCSSSPGATVATTAPPNSVDLRMTVWTSNEDQLALFDSIAEEYQADHPEIKEIFAQINPKLTDDVMRELNARVDVDGEDPAEVARDWLVDEGLVKMPD